MAVYLASSSDIKTLMDVTDTALDAKIVLVLDMVYSKFETVLMRRLESLARTEKYYGLGQMVPLKALGENFTVGTIASVVITDNDGTTTTLATTDYVKQPYGIKLINYTLTGYNYITVTYTSGYAKDGNNVLTLGEDSAIRRAAILQVLHEFKRVKTPGYSKITTPSGQSEFTREINLLKEVEDTLAYYKHPFYVGLL